VKPDGLFLIMELMHFAHEVLEPETLKGATVDVSEKELAMAKSLIESMTAEWEPAKYKDQYQDAVMAMIEAKAQNAPQEAAAAAPQPKMNVVDLVSILQQSIQKAGEKKNTGSRTASRTTASLVKKKRRVGAL
jgi:DNA end-binding protein Ku